MTPQQDLLVKAEIDADPALSSQALDGEGLQAVANALNAFVGDFPVWRTRVPTQEIYNAIEWDKYTPVDNPVQPALPAAPTQTEAALAAVQANRAAYLRLKQENLQTMLLMQDWVNASLPGIRKTLRDAVIQLPAGVNGATVTAGGANAATVLQVCLRQARRVEKVLATDLQASDTTGGTLGRVMGFEGLLTSTDIDRIRRAQ